MFFLLSSLLAFPLLVSCAADPSTTYQFSATLVQDYYWLYWNFSSVTQSISFAVRVRTTGWIGFGLSPNGQMPGSDVVIGWIDSSSSGPVFHDRYAFGRYMPPIDPIQNWFLTSATVDNGYTTLEFYRDFITCDDLDRKILLETAHVLYSWNDNYQMLGSLSSLSKHTNKGSTSINLLGGLPDAPSIPEDSQTFTIAVNEVEIPSYQTTYWCTGIQLDSSITENENYIIKISPYISSNSQPYVHHMLVYLCNDLQDSDLEGGGGDCDSGISNQMRSCLSQMLIAAWAVGGSDFIYPEHVAYPIGGSGGAQYAVIQIHYNNIEQVSGVVDSSGFVFTYIDTPRQYDAGILFFGHGVSPSMIIPPNAHNFTTMGLCSDPCTRKYFPSDGIHIFANMLHTHLAGSGLKLAHISDAQCNDGKSYQELEPIERNLYYDFNFQQATHLPKEIKVLPGDNLLLECYYNTTARSGVTLGGESTLQEMCLSFPVYYPRIELAKCISLPMFDNFDKFVDSHVPYEHKQAFYSLTPGSSRETLEYTLNLLDWSDNQVDGFQNYVYPQGLQWSICGDYTYFNKTPSVSCCSYEAPDVCAGIEPVPCCQRCCHTGGKCGVGSNSANTVSLLTALLLSIGICTFVSI